jgi:hypothetical protein
MDTETTAGPLSVSLEPVSEAISSPMSVVTTAYLRGIWGSSGSDVFAVGYYGTILHYDGASWSLMDSGMTRSLYGVWGSSSTNVFAVGYYGTILHYDGDPDNDGILADEDNCPFVANPDQADFDGRVTMMMTMTESLM